MNSLNTLFFPGTAIRSLRLYPVYLLFQNVHLLSPVEDPRQEDGKESPDSFIKSGFCQVHTPCPLGPDRNRFLHLVADIKNGKDDYAAQLSSLTLAAMTESSSQAEDTERSIIRSLSGTHDLPSEVLAKKELEKLWQARLILAIGEQLDQEEEEIALNLAVLEDEEKGLFKTLQGEDDQEDEENPFAELSRMEGSLRIPSTGNVKKRYSAWRTLFLAGNILECNTFLTRGKESGDILLEAYQQKTGQEAPLLVSLELPAFLGWNTEEASAAVQEFTARNSALLATIQAKFTELLDLPDRSQQQIEAGASLPSLADAWQKQLAVVFPAKQFGRTAVSFHLFAGFSCASLVGHTSDSNSPSRNGLLAVLG